VGSISVQLTGIYVQTGTAAIGDAGLPGFFRRSPDENFPFKASSDYIGAARGMDDFGPVARNPEWLRVRTDQEIPAWTDDYSNMMVLVRWW
jgi:hypothetical protein